MTVIVVSDNKTVINKTIPFEKGDHHCGMVGEYNSIVGNGMVIKGGPSHERYSISVYGMKVTSKYFMFLVVSSFNFAAVNITTGSDGAVVKIAL